MNMIELNRFARRTLQAAALAVVAITAATVPLKPASAGGWHHGWYGGPRVYGGVYFGGPVYYGPPPVYYAPPPPVYYAPPPPVYYAPPPAYYAPPSLGLNVVIPIH
jgi:hypothetical protein